MHAVDARDLADACQTQLTREIHDTLMGSSADRHMFALERGVWGKGRVPGGERGEGRVVPRWAQTLH